MPNVGKKGTKNMQIITTKMKTAFEDSQKLMNSEAC